MTQAEGHAVTIVVPSLKVSGGIREALRLAEDLDTGGLPARILAMWASPHPMKTTASVAMLSDWAPRIARAPVELPLLLWRFARWLRSRRGERGGFVFTHYATLPLALLVARRQRYFFVQDLEWNFIGNGVLAAVLRRIVLGFYRTGRIVSANSYLTECLRREGLDVALQAPIWADPGFAAQGVSVRDLDFVMVLRKGAHKRLDLYRRFMSLARQRGLRVAAITPEDEIAALADGEANELLLRPDAAEMKTLYGRSKCFIHLSEHEGFGLPPLEAMGSGCVPICRDSGGVRAFMQRGALEDNLLPLDVPLEAVFDHAARVVDDQQAWQRLSSQARERFDTGLRAVVQARDQLAERFVQQANR